MTVVDLHRANPRQAGPEWDVRYDTCLIDVAWPGAATARTALAVWLTPPGEILAWAVGPIGDVSLPRRSYASLVAWCGAFDAPAPARVYVGTHIDLGFFASLGVAVDHGLPLHRSTSERVLGRVSRAVSLLPPSSLTSPGRLTDAIRREINRHRGAAQ